MPLRGRWGGAARGTQPSPSLASPAILNNTHRPQCPHLNGDMQGTNPRVVIRVTNEITQPYGSCLVRKKENDFPPISITSGSPLSVIAKNLLTLHCAQPWPCPPSSYLPLPIPSAHCESQSALK